jgi:hypothetical protein
MQLYKFRITFDDVEDTFKDIEVLPDTSLLLFLETILTAIKFDTKHKAKLYYSDDTWYLDSLIKEYAVTDKVKATLADIIDEPRQKMVLLYHNWRFNIELLKISEPRNKVKYPNIVSSLVILPPQYPEAIINNKIKKSKEEDVNEGLLAKLTAELGMLGDLTDEPDEEDIAMVEDDLLDVVTDDVASLDFSDFKFSEPKKRASTESFDDLDMEEEYLEDQEDEFKENYGTGHDGGGDDIWD